MFAPGLVPVFGVGEEAYDAGERVDDGRAAGGADVIPAHGHVALRAAVDLVVHGEVHGPACRRVVDEGFHHSRVRDLRGDVQVADGPARAVPVEPADARRDNPASSGVITSTKTELQILQ